MAQIDPALMEAAGFTGASAQQAITSGQSKAAINTNQLNLGGVQERRGITDQAESSGMLRSTMTNTALGEQTAGQANKQQLIDLGLNDTVTGASIDVMQELAQQQAAADAQASQKAQFDAQMALQWQKLNLEHPEALARTTTPQLQFKPTPNPLGGSITAVEHGGGRGY
jgi:hypothetical protein